MNARSYLPFVAAGFVLGIFATHPTQAAEKPKKDRQAELEAATRLQVFLDRAEFGPGKIDGRYGEFTAQALALYRQAHGKPAPEPATPAPGAKKADAAPDVTGLDLATIDPVFIDYTVTEADLEQIGELPEAVPAQAKLKSMPYRSAAEAIAEKFHADQDFLEELNPGKTKSIKAGDVLRVPNVEPFELAAVKDLKPGGEVAAKETEDAGDKATEKSDQKKQGAEKSDDDKAGKKDTDAKTATAMLVKIDTKTSMLSVYEAERLIAAFPVTIGSEATESPVGEWKVQGVAKMPDFRYDKAMLKRGERSDDFHILPPGPNNPVGVIWIALNKKGIGLHGTNDPESIGRSASHGCVRLANWDVVRLAGKVKAGVPVTIR